MSSIHGPKSSLEVGNGNPPRTLAWRIPWTEEPGGLQSTGSKGVKTQLSTHEHGNNPSVCWQTTETLDTALDVPGFSEFIRHSLTLSAMKLLNVSTLDTALDVPGFSEFIRHSLTLSATKLLNVSFPISGTCVHVCCHSVMSNSLQPHGLWPARLLCPWDSPGKDSGMGCPVLLRWILPTQRSTLQF